MIKNEELKTSPKQRLVIIAIAIFMLASTFALYAGIVLNYGNNTAANQANSEKQARFEELYEEYSKKVDAQSKELSNVYFEEFSGYRSQVKAFNAASVNALTVNDLKVGDGAEIDSLTNTNYAAYYVGWLADETVFDSSFDDFKNATHLNAPLMGSTSMIQGWLEGLARNEEEGKVIWEGMRIGGVREITIPAALGYGDQAQGTIPANSPLKFIVKLIPVPEEIPVGEELEKLYTELYGA